MLTVNAIKSACDLLLCFTFASLFSSFGDSWLLIGAMSALAFLSSLILQKAKGAVAAKIVCALLPAFGLFAAQNLFQIIVSLAILAFHAVMTFSAGSGVHYDDYKYWFGIPAVPVTVVFIICLGEWPIRPAATVCAAAYLFFGVLVLRRKRMGTGATLKLRVLNLAELSLAFAIPVLASVLIYLLISHSGAVLEVVALPFGYLFRGIAYISEQFFNLFKPPEEVEIPETTDTEAVTGEATVVPETGETAARDDTVYNGIESAAQIIVIILALAALAFILYRIYKMIRKRRGKDADGVTFEEGEISAVRDRRVRRKRKKPAPQTNREKIRKIYTDYLYYLKNHGVEITRHSTSEDVLAATEDSSPDGAERMRELYIRARYNDAEEISDAEVEEAEALLAAIRKR
ncbi:MAG: hypothetical protein IJS45_00280 [Clostridia bacterium]|nr:hypothetical protein [Clostridia bacterium]